MTVNFQCFKFPMIVPEVCKNAVGIGVGLAWELVGFSYREESVVLFTMSCMRQETKGSILGEERCR